MPDAANLSVKVGVEGISQAQSQLQGFGRSLSSTGQRMESVGRAATLGLTLPITAGFAGATKAAIDWESSFTGVRKTVDASEAQFATLSREIRQMSKEIPVAATEIAGIAESAGQLGIQTPNIVGFSRTMADLGATTDMAGDQAATSLARLANITGMAQTDFDRLGSTIVHLGNNLATTESEITEMGLRIAGAGNQVGLTEAQILSFAGALSSVGIRAEAGGTAISRVMLDMSGAVDMGGEKLQGFADVAGMSVDQFRTAFEEDAAGAILSFIEGLGQIQESGGNTTAILEDLELGEIRVRDALLRASGASDLFADSLRMGTQAWDENNALTEEAQLRYDTIASKLGIVQNKLMGAATVIGEDLAPMLVTGAEATSDFAEWFSELDETARRAAIGIGLFAAAAGPVLWGAGSVIRGGAAVRGLFGRGAGAGAGSLAGGMAQSVGTMAVQASVVNLTGPVAGGMTGAAGRGATRGAAAAGAGGAAAAGGVGAAGFFAGLAALGIPAWFVRQAEQNRIEENTSPDDSFFDRVGTGFQQSWEAEAPRWFATDLLPTVGDAIGTGASAARDTVGLGADNATPHDFEPESSTFEAQLEWVPQLALGNRELQFMEENLLNLPMDQLVDPAINEEIKAQAQSVRQHKQAVAELHEENTIFQIQATDPAVAEAIHREAEAAVRLREAHAAISQSVTGLATAYQDGIAIQAQFGDQQSEYATQLGSVESAIEILQERQANGIELTSQEQALLENSEGILERYQGGVEDAAVEVGLAAGANAELMQAQDNLTIALGDGEPTVQEIKDAMLNYRDSLENAAAMSGQSIEDSEFQQSAFSNLQDVLGNSLTPSVMDYGRELGLIPEGIETELTLMTASAYENLQAIRAEASKPVYLPVNLQQGGGFGTANQVGGGLVPAFADGGTNIPEGLGWVGEEGRELMYIPGGSTIIPHDESERLAALMEAGAIPGFADGGGPGISVDSPESVDWGWMFEGMPFAAGQASEATVEILTDLSARIRESMTGPDADSIADALVEGLSEDMDQLPGLISNVTPEVLAELAILRNEMENELEIAQIAGDSDAAGELSGNLNVISRIMTAWAAETGIEVRDAMGNILNADEMIDEWAQAIADQQALDDAWTSSLSDLDRIIDGSVMESLQGELDELNQQLAVATSLGLSDGVIDGIEQAIAETEGEMTRVGEIHAAAYAAGFIESDAVPKMTDSMVADLVAMGIDGGQAMTDSILDGLDSGRLDLSQAVELLPDSGIPGLQDMAADLEEELQNALITGSDPTEALSNYEQVIAILDELGVSAESLGDVNLDDLISGNSFEAIDTMTGEAQRINLAEGQSVEDALNDLFGAHGERFVPDLSGLPTPEETKELTDWVTAGQLAMGGGAEESSIAEMARVFAEDQGMLDPDQDALFTQLGEAIPVEGLTRSLDTLNAKLEPGTGISGMELSDDAQQLAPMLRDGGSLPTTDPEGNARLDRIVDAVTKLSETEQPLNLDVSMNMDTSTVARKVFNLAQRNQAMKVKLV